VTAKNTVIVLQECDECQRIMQREVCSDRFLGEAYCLESKLREIDESETSLASDR